MGQSSMHIEPSVLGREGRDADCPPAAFPARIPELRGAPAVRPDRPPRGRGGLRIFVLALALAAGVGAAAGWVLF